MPLAYYAVGIDHDVDEGSLTALDPQPFSPGLMVARRAFTTGPAPAIIDHSARVPLIYTGLYDGAQYRAVLAQFGLSRTNKTQAVTINCRDAEFGWVILNGFAIFPRMGEDAEWSQYFPRNMTIWVASLEAGA